jgi:Ankyrin repeats (3 copies)/Ankyrin repeat
MSNNIESAYCGKEISPRYYGAEIFLAILLGTSYLVYLVPLHEYRIPGTDICVKNVTVFIRVITVLQIATLAYVIRELYQIFDNQKKKEFYGIMIFFCALFLGTCSSIYLHWQNITLNFPFSIWWFAGYFLLGEMFALNTSPVLEEIRMIRTKEDAARLELPRVPVPSCGVFLLMAYILPLTIIIGAIFFFFVPTNTIKYGLPIIGLVIVASYTRPLTRKLDKRREIYEWYDYQIRLIDTFGESESVRKDLGSSLEPIKKFQQRIKKQAKIMYKLRAFFKKNFPSVVAEQRISSDLFDAVELGSFGLVEKAIEKGDKVNEQFGARWTPFQLAIANGDIDIAQYLLKKGANPDLANVLHRTPLMFATHYGNKQAVKLLLKYQCNLNMQDFPELHTALMVAIIKKNEDIAKFLIDAGADLMIKNLKGKDALALAHEYQMGDIARLIKMKTGSLVP